MTDPRRIKVMIVDDHPIVRDGLKSMLLAFDDLKLVGEAGDGNEALVQCGQTQPDVILMDMVMPGMDGIVATGAILELYPQMKIIMLTSFVEDSVRSPARLTIASAPSARWPQPAAVFASQRSRRTLAGMPAVWPGLRLKIMVSWPSPASWPASCRPIQPVPPVIMIRMVRSSTNSTDFVTR